MSFLQIGMGKAVLSNGRKWNYIYVCTMTLKKHQLLGTFCVLSRSIQFAVLLRMWRLHQRINEIEFFLYCGCFNLFCNVWVCVCVGFVMCGCFGNMCTCIYRVLYFCTVFFVLFRLCTFILICFVRTSVRTTGTE